MMRHEAPSVARARVRAPARLRRARLNCGIAKYDFAANYVCNLHRVEGRGVR